MGQDWAVFPQGAECDSQESTGDIQLGMEEQDKGILCWRSQVVLCCRGLKFSTSHHSALHFCVSTALMWTLLSQFLHIWAVASQWLHFLSCSLPQEAQAAGFQWGELCCAASGWAAVPRQSPGTWAVPWPVHYPDTVTMGPSSGGAAKRITGHGGQSCEHRAAPGTVCKKPEMCPGDTRVQHKAWEQEMENWRHQGPVCHSWARGWHWSQARGTQALPHLLSPDSRRAQNKPGVSMTL